LDSGTTFTYLYGKVFDNLQGDFDKFCRNSKKPKKGSICGGNMTYANNYCTVYDEAVYGN